MAEINVTPMVDVMLVLLIIFMVAAPLMVQGVPLDLPRPRDQARPLRSRWWSRSPPTACSRSATSASSDALVNPLMVLRRDEGDSVVYVRADRKIPTAT